MSLPFDHTWTLFLDRDGVINTHTPGYILNEEQFVFRPGVLEAIPRLNAVFGRIVVVTNQKGVHKGLMTEADLLAVHAYMLNHIEAAGGFLDAVYACTQGSEAPCRKPEPGMALQAQADFPEIDFARSVMLGDALTDMQFGQRLGMRVYHVLGGRSEPSDMEALERPVDGVLESLWDFACLVG